MIRAAVTVLLAVTLSGCWTAEKQLFTAAHLTQPAGLEGSFISEDAAGQEQGTVVLTRRPDGLIEGTVTPKEGPAPRQSAIGFAAIPGGSGRYFLMVNRANEPGRNGELYLLARWSDERLEAFWPQCAGTPDMPGMKREEIEIVKQSYCTFASREAVLRAALLAERELETKRLFEHQLLGRLKRAQENPAPTPEPEPED